MNISILTFLIGLWYVQFTSFPMWLKGDKQQPTFQYESEIKKGVVGLSDVVTYKKAGKEQKIVGFDTPLNPEQTQYIWQGKGFTSLFKSKWKVVYIGENGNWALIYFSKTLATPEGYDVISRNATLSAEENQEIMNYLKTMKLDGKLTKIR